MLEEQHRKFINYIEQAYHATGDIPAVNEIAEALNYQEATVKRHFQHRDVQAALLRRGIDVLEDHHNLNPSQLTAAMLATSVPDRRQLNRKLKEAGITPAQFDGWLRLPKFQRFLKARVESNMAGVLPLAESALSNAAIDGDLKSIQFLMEITGRYRPNSGTNLNMEVMLVRISEIVSTAVNNTIQDSALRSEVLQSIAAGLLKLLPDGSIPHQTAESYLVERQPVPTYQPAVAGFSSPAGFDFDGEE